MWIEELPPEVERFGWEGFNAYFDGHYLGACLYPNPSQRRLAWEAGYRSAIHYALHHHDINPNP